jgi:membrane-associated protease RseP (regulator of RpoE activity)
MRLVILFIVALAVGLAAQWLPRVLGEDAAVDAVPSPTRVTQSSGMRAAQAPAASREALEPHEPLADDPPPEISAEPEPDRTTRLISAGFAPERAQEIVRKESDLRRAAIEDEYATSGTIRPLNAASPAAVELQMRAWMGDTEYELYLKGIGHTTRIRIGEVESDSAAANAGIVSGDEILRYAGRRVFNLRDLNALMLQTPEGETVSATVVRGGQEMELYVTGGALGISPAPTLP